MLKKMCEILLPPFEEKNFFGRSILPRADEVHHKRTTNARIKKKLEPPLQVFTNVIYVKEVKVKHILFRG
jgi:hypothetical protein